MTKQELKNLIKEVIDEINVKDFSKLLKSNFPKGSIVKFLTNPRTEHDTGEDHPNPKYAIGKIIEDYMNDFDIKELKPATGKMHYSVPQSSIVKKIK